MNKVVISSVVAGLLLLTGCAQKSAETSDKGAAAPVAKASGGDNMAALMASIQGKLTNVYFDFDKFNIRKDQAANVAQDADVLKSTDASKFSYKVEGNCDEWGSDEYNYALGLKRATTLKDALVTAGVNESKLTLISYGETNPTCTDKNKECWAKNRRAEIKVMP